MNISIEPKTGAIDDFYRRISRWRLEMPADNLILLVGPRSVNTTMLNAIARLGEGGPVRVLDGGNRFNAYLVARTARGQPEVLNRITISRAFTCYQVRSLLESTPASPIPFVILDLLNTFYDESVQFVERKRILRACTQHMERLVGAAGGVVTIHPPKIPSPEAVELLEMLQGTNVDSYFFQPVAPAPEPMRLF